MKTNYEMYTHWLETQSDVAEQQLNNLILTSNYIAREKGWWDSRNLEDINTHIATLALMMREVSEGIEALRDGNLTDKHLPEYDSLTVEMADTVIRIMDYCGQCNMPLAKAITAKMKYNTTREYKHGKKA